MINQISKYYNGENMKYFPQKSKFKLSKKKKKKKRKKRYGKKGGERGKVEIENFNLNSTSNENAN